MIDIRLLGSDEADVLAHVDPDVFDHAVSPAWTAAFFADPRHHLAVARDGETVVGMATGVHYVHPDKPPVLWVNEVGVATPYRRQGIGRRLLDVLVAHGRTLGCTEAWLGTEASNTAARALYASAGWTLDPEPFVMYSVVIAPE